VRVAKETGCCLGEQARLAELVQQALGRQPGVKVLTDESSAPRPAVKDPDLQAATVELRGALARAKNLYVRMQMDAVQKELGRALSSVKRLSGAYLEAKEIATLHLYLAAVSQATDQKTEAREHAEAAIRFYSDLQPDPDVFTPPVRAEIEKARQSRRTVDVTVVSEPAGARVLWDGTARGETPATLTGQTLGEHYLRLQRAGSRPWHDTIVLSSASAQLQVKLQPSEAAPPASVMAADELMLHADGEGLRLALQPRDGSATRTARLAKGADGAYVEAAVQQLLGTTAGPDPGPGPTPKGTPDGTRAHFKRYWWAYVAAGVVVVTLAIAIPVGVSHGGSSSGRPVKLPIP
jgi:hypothetical protein